MTRYSSFSINLRYGCLLVILALAPYALATRASAGTCQVTPSPSWKNSIQFPEDSFRANSGAPGEPSWVKFTILTCNPTTVYYQDSVQFEFHFDFATQILDPLLGLSLEDFNNVTLFNGGREAFLGAVVIPPPALPPLTAIPEYGIQIIGQDPIDPQVIVDLFNAVRNTVIADAGVQPLYFPTFEQLETAEQNTALFAANGIEISSPARWADGNSCYSQGWALGRLKFVPADQIDAAFLAGDLKIDDILLTDGIPASIPLVAGIVSLAPATPNSHVVILANTFQVPFTFLGLQADADKALSMIGKRVALRVFEKPVTGLFGLGTFICDVRFIDADGLTQQETDEVLALKIPPPLNIQPIAPLGNLSASTNGMTPSDIDHFGGKAANFGFLRRAIPNDSPVSLAISFDLWTDFLNQTLVGGMTLKQEIDAILSQHTVFPPPDAQALADALDTIRDMIKDDTNFTPQQEADILALLQDPQFGFDPVKKIRFRSSTNVEDSEQFTGAGLYDSNSGCLVDDLDADQIGPSFCDPTNANERGVFRAIRRVFASFYNDNAYLERLRHGVDEDDVGMAILVHHSFPDEIELANGVATYERKGGFFNDSILLVTQDGANSVTNPENGAIPEEVDVNVVSPTTFQVTLSASSNLVLLGETVMDWQADYVELSQLLLAVADQFESETGKTAFVLDFEYKKMAPGGGVLPAGGLVVKQVREIPQPDTTPSITPFLLNEPTQFVTNGSPPGRVKARWTLSTKNLRLDPATLATTSIYADASFSFNDGCTILALDGNIPTLPGASHSYDAVNKRTADTWVLNELPNPRTYTLNTRNLGLLVSPAESPILTLRDLGEVSLIEVQVQHANPVPPNMVTMENVIMRPIGEYFDAPPTIPCGGRQYDFPGGVFVTTCFSIQPIGPICGGCTPILDRFHETTIEGITSEPLVLRSLFSQSYSASNHAFFEVLRFEPILDPGVPAHLLDELVAQDIRVIQIDINNLGNPSGITLSFFNDAEVGRVCGPCSNLAVGDINGDTLMNGDDISDFISVLINTPAGPNETCVADMNSDTFVNPNDIPLFVEAVLGIQ
ncbi:MAG: PEP/pyruvate-binding domain-containing protein [Phycisphaerales bacterium]|nr:PEP/pyruvate-binding domain-containing protein [Phycisphaerales bacterium]